ncbi:hypothetical protein [Dactylosporangium sp. CA-139066]|uniref:hypothetical protein n=1 Tax=Dactylosporangium sp. CA-139066 TaxID=3239930 RepID=UPI003D93F7BC
MNPRRSAIDHVLALIAGVAGLTPDAVRAWAVEPHPALTGGPLPWQRRLAGALERGLR